MVWDYSFFFGLLSSSIYSSVFFCFVLQLRKEKKRDREDVRYCEPPCKEERRKKRQQNVCDHGFVVMSGEPSRVLNFLFPRVLEPLNPTNLATTVPQKCIFFIYFFTKLLTFLRCCFSFHFFCVFCSMCANRGMKKKEEEKHFVLVCSRFFSFSLCVM